MAQMKNKINETKNVRSVHSVGVGADSSRPSTRIV